MIVEHDVTVRHEHDNRDEIEVRCEGKWVKFERKRTCHMVEQPDGYGSYDDVCSECGAFDSGTPYCWKCGAKVVEG